MHITRTRRRTLSWGVALVIGVGLTGSTALISAQAAASGCGVLRTGESLGRGESVPSCNGRYLLAHQTDGNVVLYGPDGPVYNTVTHGQATTTFAMQSDGNVVLYNGATPLVNFSSSAAGQDASLAIQDDGNLVVYTKSGEAIWAISAGGLIPFALTGRWATPGATATVTSDGTVYETQDFWGNRLDPCGPVGRNLRLVPGTQNVYTGEWRSRQTHVLNGRCQTNVVFRPVAVTVGPKTLAVRETTLPRPSDSIVRDYTKG